MGKECADNPSAAGIAFQGDYHSTCDCGWHIPITDVAWIAEHGVTHVVCYNCGKEWVE